MVNEKVLFLCTGTYFNLQMSVPYLTVISFKNVMYLSFRTCLMRPCVAQCD